MKNYVIYAHIKGVVNLTEAVSEETAREAFAKMLSTRKYLFGRHKVYCLKWTVDHEAYGTWTAMVDGFVDFTVYSDSIENAMDDAEELVYQGDFGSLENIEYRIVPYGQMEQSQVLDACLRKCRDEDERQTIGVLLPVQRLLLFAQWGSGDQLLPEDEEAGFTQYVDFTCYDVTDEVDDPEKVKEILSYTEDDLYTLDAHYEQRGESGCYLLSDEQCGTAHWNLARLIPEILDQANLKFPNKNFAKVIVCGREEQEKVVKYVPVTYQKCGYVRVEVNKNATDEAVEETVRQAFENGEPVCCEEVVDGSITKTDGMPVISEEQFHKDFTDAE